MERNHYETLERSEGNFEAQECCISIYGVAIARLTPRLEMPVKHLMLINLVTRLFFLRGKPQLISVILLKEKGCTLFFILYIWHKCAVYHTCLYWYMQCAGYDGFSLTFKPTVICRQRWRQRGIQYYFNHGVFFLHALIHYRPDKNL